MIITYPNNAKEKNAIKAFLKLLNVRFEITDNLEPTKSAILDNIKVGLEEAKKYESGKLKTTTAKDFLNEL